MRDLLEQKLARFGQLEKDLVDPEVLSHARRLASTAREHGSLTKLATKYRRFKQLHDEIGEMEEMVAGDDMEMRQLAEVELEQLQSEREQLWNELLELTIGGEDANRVKIIMEIRAGTGGDEACFVCTRFVRDVQASC